MKRGSYRAIYSVLLDDLDFRKLPARVRHIFLTLKISRLNNIANIFLLDEGGLVTISAQAGIPLEGVQEGIQILSEGDWVCFEPPVIWIKNGLRYDPLFVEANENHRKAVTKVIEGLPKCKTIISFCKYYNLDIPFEYPSDTLETPSPITDSDSDNEYRIQNTDSDNRFRSTDSEEILSGKPDCAPDNNILYKSIIEDLNDKAGANYKSGTQKTRDLIKARWNEGFRLDDFKIVHIKKIGEWKGTKMAKFIRPITLYGTKFESYLNQIPEDNRFSETTKHNLEVLNEWLREKKAQDAERG